MHTRRRGEHRTRADVPRPPGKIGHHSPGRAHETDRIEQVDLQLSREPFPYPQLVIKRKPADIFSYAFEDFEVVDYQHHATIKAPVAV